MAAIPEGFSTITPHIVVSDANGAMALYEKALGAERMGAMPMKGTNKIMHAAMKLGTSVLFLQDELEQFPRKAPKGTASTAFYLYIEDCDKAYEKAIKGGMKSLSKPEDMFWGDRTAVASDPYGYNWTFATHVKDVSPADMEKAMAEMA